MKTTITTEKVQTDFSYTREDWVEFSEKVTNRFDELEKDNFNVILDIDYKDESVPYEDYTDIYLDASFKYEKGLTEEEIQEEIKRNKLLEIKDKFYQELDLMGFCVQEKCSILNSKKLCYAILSERCDAEELELYLDNIDNIGDM